MATNKISAFSVFKAAKERTNIATENDKRFVRQPTTRKLYADAKENQNSKQQVISFLAHLKPKLLLYRNIEGLNVFHVC